MLGSLRLGHAGVKGNDQAETDWRAKLPSQMARVLDDLKCSGAWDSTCRHKAKRITPLTAWRRGVERGSPQQSIRRTVELLQRWRWENFWEMGWECIQVFPESIDTILTWHDRNWTGLSCPIIPHRPPPQFSMVQIYVHCHSGAQVPTATTTTSIVVVVAAVGTLKYAEHFLHAVWVNVKTSCADVQIIWILMELFQTQMHLIFTCMTWPPLAMSDPVMVVVKLACRLCLKGSNTDRAQWCSRKSMQKTERKQGGRKTEWIYVYANSANNNSFWDSVKTLSCHDSWGCNM